MTKRTHALQHVWHYNTNAGERKKMPQRSDRDEMFRLFLSLVRFVVDDSSHLRNWRIKLLQCSVLASVGTWTVFFTIESGKCWCVCASTYYIVHTHTFIMVLCRERTLAVVPFWLIEHRDIPFQCVNVVSTLRTIAIRVVTSYALVRSVSVVGVKHCRLSRKLDQLQILRAYFSKWKCIALAWRTHQKSQPNSVVCSKRVVVGLRRCVRFTIFRQSNSRLRLTLCIREGNIPINNNNNTAHTTRTHSSSWSCCSGGERTRQPTYLRRKI